MFATILSQRLSITFIRVISFAFAGAKDYSPIINHAEQRGDGKPNWSGIKDIFATIKQTYLLVSFITTLFVILGLLFGINNLIDEFKDEYIFIIFIVGISTFFTQILIKYNIFLRGFNEVAFVNRWNTLFGLLGIVAVFIVVKSGGGLIILVSAQFLIPIFASLRQRCLFNKILQRNKIKNNGNFDNTILLAIKEPFWKGLVGHLSQMGTVQLSGIIFTMFGNPVIVAKYLFSLRILTMLAEFAQVPFTSNNPYFSKLRSEGKIKLLAKVFQTRILFSLISYSAGVILVLLFSNYLLSIIGSNVELISSDMWLLMSMLYSIERMNILYFAILASANQIVMYKEQVLSAIITLIAILFAIDSFGLYGLILAVWLPRILIFNIMPLKLSAISLNINISSHALKTMPPVCFLLIVMIFRKLC